MSVHVISNDVATEVPSSSSSSSSSFKTLEHSPSGLSLRSFGSSIMSSMRSTRSRVRSLDEKEDPFGNLVLCVNRLGDSSTVRFVEVHRMPFFSVLDVLTFLHSADVEPPTQEQLETWWWDKLPPLCRELLAKNMHVHFFSDAIQLGSRPSSNSSDKYLPPSPVSSCAFGSTTDFVKKTRPAFETITLAYRDVIKMMSVAALPPHVIWANMEAFMTYYSLAFHSGAQPVSSVPVQMPTSKRSLYTCCLHNLLLPAFLVAIGFLLSLLVMRFL